MFIFFLVKNMPVTHQVAVYGDGQPLPLVAGAYYIPNLDTHTYTHTK